MLCVYRSHTLTVYLSDGLEPDSIWFHHHPVEMGLTWIESDPVMVCEPGEPDLYSVGTEGVWVSATLERVRGGLEVWLWRHDPYALEDGAPDRGLVGYVTPSGPLTVLCAAFKAAVPESHRVPHVSDWKVAARRADAVMTWWQKQALRLTELPDGRYGLELEEMV